FDAGHRDLPHGAIGRFSRRVRPLPIHAYCLPLLRQPPLPQVSRLGSGKVAAETTGRVVAHRVLPCGLYAPRAYRRHRLLQQRCYDLLFRATDETVLTTARDPERLGVEIGFFAVLHSWGQNPIYTAWFPAVACRLIT